MLHDSENKGKKNMKKLTGETKTMQWNVSTQRSASMHMFSEMNLEESNQDTSEDIVSHM